MVTAVQHMTADELLQLPDDGNCYELIKGELITMSPPGFQHGRVAMKIASHLDQHIKKYKLGVVCAAETGFKIASEPDTVRTPDTAFISMERVNEVGDTVKYWPGAPNVAVEVVSPNDNYSHVEDKVNGWLEAGTELVIIVNPLKRIVTVYRSRTNIVMLTEDETLHADDVVAGWSIPVKEIFV